MCRCRSCRICDNCWLLSLHQMSMSEHKFNVGCLKQGWKQKLGLRFGNVEQWTHPPLMCFINPCSTPGPGSVTMIWIVCQDIDGRPPGDAKGKATKGTYGPLNCREGYNNNLIMKPCLLKRSTPNTSRYWCPCNPGEVRVNRLDTAFELRREHFTCFRNARSTSSSKSVTLRFSVGQDLDVISPRDAKGKAPKDTWSNEVQGTVQPTINNAPLPG